MDPDELQKLSQQSQPEESIDVVDKILTKDFLPNKSIAKKEKLIIKPKKEILHFAERASELEHEHIEKIKSTLPQDGVPAGVSVS